LPWRKERQEIWSKRVIHNNGPSPRVVHELWSTQQSVRELCNTSRDDHPKSNTSHSVCFSCMLLIEHYASCCHHRSDCRQSESNLSYME
jgi:hypothetical protein